MKHFFLTVVAVFLFLIFPCLNTSQAGPNDTVFDLASSGCWDPYQWNKAEGTLSVSSEFPPQLKKPQSGMKPKVKDGSLELNISWPGGEGMRFFSIVPTKTTALPKKPVKASIWVKGSDSKRYVEIHFTANGGEIDENGNPFKIILGQMDFKGWKKMEGEIPPEWPLPLQLKSISLHDWNLPDQIQETILFTRLEIHGK